MLDLIASAIFNLLEKVGWKWWVNRKEEKAIEAQNKDAALSNAAAVDELRKWTRPE